MRHERNDNSDLKGALVSFPGRLERAGRLPADFLQHLQPHLDNLGEFNRWPVLAIDYARKLGTLVGLNYYQACKLYEVVRIEGMMKFIARPDGKYYVGSDEALTLAAFFFTYATQLVGDRAKYKKLPAATRELFADYPAIVERVYDSQTGGERTNRPDGQRPGLPPLNRRHYRHHKPTLTFGEITGPYRWHIPEISPEERILGEEWNVQEVVKLLNNKLRGRVSDVDYAQDIPDVPDAVVRMIMFIHAAHMRNLSTFDPSCESVVVFEFNEALRFCLAYLGRYPQIRNVTQLFLAIRDRVLSDDKIKAYG